jgi:hypothetical protein
MGSWARSIYAALWKSDGYALVLPRLGEGRTPPAWRDERNGLRASKPIVNSRIRRRHRRLGSYVIDGPPLNFSRECSDVSEISCAEVAVKNLN